MENNLANDTERLERENKHPRDSNIKFLKEPHKYLVSKSLEETSIKENYDNDFISVTTFLDAHFDTFNSDLAIEKMMKGHKWKEGHKWWGWSKQALKQEWKRMKNDAAENGIKFHFRIEQFMNNNELKYPYTFKDLLENFLEKHDVKNICEANIQEKEWLYFLNFIRDFSLLQPYRTEWRIYHDDVKIAGSIDLLCKIFGTEFYVLIDWKFSKEIKNSNDYKHFAKTACIKHLADNNFVHYSLQQNLYKTILKEKYGINIIKMYLIRIHRESENYELIDVPDMTNEIKLLLEERRKVI